MKNNMKNKGFRNGDWSFMPYEGELKGEKMPQSKSFTFGEGEVTNHFHVATTPDITSAQWYKQEDGSWLVDFRDIATISHPEHSEKVNLEIPAGVYRVYKRLEKDWFSGAVRQVRD